MQLSGKASIRSALTAATAALLGSGHAHAAGGNRVESSLLLYSETDRVKAAEGLLNITHALKGDRFLNVRFVLDGLTGASPNGATPSRYIQTFTRPSGGGSYSVQPGVTPLDASFKDTRFGADAGLTQPLGRLSTLLYGAHLSLEHDYSSLGANLGFTHDLNRKNTTFAASAAYSYDVVSPLGGAPVPLSVMPPPSSSGGEGEGEGEGEDDGSPGKGKNVFDLVAGVTQVLDRKTLLRLNYSFNNSSGYLNDPYKLVSIVQGPSGTEPGEPVGYVYEARPGGRTKQAAYAELRRFLGGHTIDLSYRYFWDDWGTTSHTVELFYRLPLPAGHALQPHLRWYQQTEADFYRTYLLDGAPLPASASADSRLAPFHAATVGLQYVFPVAQDTHLNIDAEYYTQTGDLSPPQSMGPLSQYELFPKMQTFMIRVGFTRDY
jgi:hypothetical protein